MKKLISLLLCISMILSISPVVMAETTEIIIDNTDSNFTVNGEWTASTSSNTSGFYGSNFIHDGNTGKSPDKWAKWTPDLPQDGVYKVYMMWAANGNRTNAAPVEIYHNGITENMTINQKVSANEWNELGTYQFSKGTESYVKIIATSSGYTVADAVKFVLDPDADLTVQDIIIDNADAGCTFVNDPKAGESGDGTWRTGSSVAGFYGTNYATTDTDTASDAYAVATAKIAATGKYNLYFRWSAGATRASAVPVRFTYGDLSYETTVNQRTGSGAWNKIGTYDLTAGMDVSFTVYASANGYTTFDAVKIEYIPDFTVVNVSDYQVYQREIGGNSAMVPISASNSDETAVSIKARVLKYDTEEVVVDWTELVTDNTTGVVTKEIEVPQGGWYKTEIVSYDKGGNPLKRKVSDKKWGVGIVILCAGQSNMEGNGLKPYVEANDLVANFNKGNTWQHLVDPYSGTGGSMTPGLGNALVEKYGIPVAFIPTAEGGMGLCTGSGPRVWITRNADDPANPATLYGNSIARARAAGGVELIVWNQGETDTRYQNDMTVYLETFKKLVANYRTDLYSTIPVFICQSGTHVVTSTINNDVSYSGLRTMQYLSDEEITDVYMASTQLEFPLVDTAHFTTPSMTKIGQRVANAIMYYYGDAEYYRGPQIESAKFTDSTKTEINLQIKHNGGDSLSAKVSDSMLTGFTVVSETASYEVTNAVVKDSDTITLTLSSAPNEDVFVRYMYGVCPDVSNCVYDNSSLNLPLECTPFDLAVAEADSEDVTYGDVNNDGVINVNDAVLLVEYIGTNSAGGILDEIKFPNGTFPGGEKSAMLTADDVINVNDVVLLVEYIGTISAGGALDEVKFPSGNFPGASR